MSVTTPWAGVTVLARHAGEIDPYDQASRHLFRGEEAFAPDVTGWRRWRKPSPEPPLDDTFRSLVLAAVERERKAISALLDTLLHEMLPTLSKPPLLVAILRAGLPVGALLARRLASWFGEPVPLVALSLFAGLGWDEHALMKALRTYPHHTVWFVDGWTSRGGVANELRASYGRWLARGHPDFTEGAGPRLAVLCDPAQSAQAAGIRADYFVPSSCFTAPETLGFSRGFATEEPGMFYVYGYPHHYLFQDYLDAWMDIVCASPRSVAAPVEQSADWPPSRFRLHSNEVVRALINRAPLEVLFRDSEAEVAANLAPVRYLCALRGVPASYERAEVGTWGALAAARMQGDA